MPYAIFYLKSFSKTCISRQNSKPNKNKTLPRHVDEVEQRDGIS